MMEKSSFITELVKINQSTTHQSRLVRLTNGKTPSIIYLIVNLILVSNTVLIVIHQEYEHALKFKDTKTQGNLYAHSKWRK